jgi:hypothetical protein
MDVDSEPVLQEDAESSLDTNSMAVFSELVDEDVQEPIGTQAIIKARNETI